MLHQDHVGGAHQRDRDRRRRGAGAGVENAPPIVAHRARLGDCVPPLQAHSEIDQRAGGSEGEAERFRRPAAIRAQSARYPDDFCDALGRIREPVTDEVLRALRDRAQCVDEERHAREQSDERHRPDGHVQKVRERDRPDRGDDEIEHSQFCKAARNAVRQPAQVAVVVKGTKLRGELRDHRCDKSGRQRGDQRRVDQGIEAAIVRNAELPAGDGVRDEAAELTTMPAVKTRRLCLTIALARRRSNPRRNRKVRGGLMLPFIESTFSWTVENLPLSGALMLTPRLFTDDRGSFRELFSLDRYRDCGIRDSFVQDNSSLSRRNVLRGLHGAARMSKIVSVLSGSAYDVIVDVRPGSPTYRRWYGTTLSAAARPPTLYSKRLSPRLSCPGRRDRLLVQAERAVRPGRGVRRSLERCGAGHRLAVERDGADPLRRDAGNPPLGSLHA